MLSNPDKLTVSDVYQRFAFVPAPHSPLALEVEQVVERGLSSPLSAYFSGFTTSTANANSASST